MASGTYVSTEDPGLKYLYLKGIITQQEYEKGLKVIEAKEYAAKPNYNIDVNNGLNIRVGSKFLLKMRLLTQARYSFSTYNEAWGTIGDSRNPEILGGQVEFRAVRQQSDSSTFTVPRTRLQFLGYAFDPDLRYNFSVAFRPNPHGIKRAAAGRLALLDAYVASWHIPWATVQVGQQRVWFNRALISSIATSTFADNLIVQNAFAANQVNSRDIGITILSDEDQYKFNYAIGIWNGAGTNLSREGTAVSQALPNNLDLPASAQRRTFNYDTRFMTGELMYTAGCCTKSPAILAMGRETSSTPACRKWRSEPAMPTTPAKTILSSIRSDIVDRAYRQAVTKSYNGRLLGGGIYDFQTYEVDFIAKYQGWSLQAEGYYRHQRVRNADSGSIPFDSDHRGHLRPPGGARPGLGLVCASREIHHPPETGSSPSGTDSWIPRPNRRTILTKEFGAAINYSFDGTYNNRLVVDYSNITMGSGGRAPDRFPFESQPGFGSDLVENRINVQYQFYF